MRAPEPSVPYGDRPTPIVDISSEVAATRSDMCATSRLRSSQIFRLVALSQDTPAATEELAPSLTETSPLTTTETTSAPRPRGVAVPSMIAVAALAAAAAVVYAKSRQPPPALPASVIAPATLAPAIAAPVVVAPPRPEAREVTAAEVHARETLDRLRTGLDACIRNGIHALPGGSPAVPPGLDSLKDGAFTPAPGDWKTAVWSCARFERTEPMDFQLQWQLVRPNAEGMGIAWIDQDRDGVADRALGFSITLGPRGEPTLGEIREIAATTPVSTLRR